MGVSHAEAASKSFGGFVDTIAALRRPDGCPWDREQTHASIASNMLEEAYEAVDAIEKGDAQHLREELGDVLLQVVLQSQIAADLGEFTIDDVCRDVDAKMIRRHPHVFGDAQASDANSVLDLWDQVKMAERNDAEEGSATKTEGLLDGVPVSFPALMQAQKISRKAVAAGFEWDTVDHVWEKVREEEAELQAAYASAPKSKNGKMVKSTPEFAEAELEMGDVLFSLVNVARKMGIDAEAALRATCMKFRKRWSAMESAAAEQGVKLEDLPMDDMQALWDKVKTSE
nr:nucleoside triphosphate pyrophosphohydrolase [Anaerotardibacter muris]